MIKANEARTFVKEFEAEVKRKHEEKLQTFCDTILTDNITTAAKEGRNKVVILNCPTDLKTEVIEKLRGSGFAATDNRDATISVCW